MITGGSKINGISTGPVQFYAPRAAGQAPVQKEKPAAGRFDSVTLSGDRYDSFAVQLTSRLTQEVRAATTPGRLHALSEQIAAGEYKPDAMEIARSMLLMAGKS